MKEIRIIIPEEDLWVVSLEPKDDLPVVIGLNRALYKFKYKKVFSWHLSVTVFYEECNNNGFPTKGELEAVSSLEDCLIDSIETHDDGKPNALFLGRVTWDKTREYIYRVYNPEIVNKNLQGIIDDGKYSRDFNFKMEHDKGWVLDKWYFDLKERL